MAELKQYLEAKKAYAAGFVSDTCVAYISTTSGTPQVWKMDLVSNKSWQVTDYEDRIMELHTNQKTGVAYFTKDTGGNEQEQIYAISSDDIITTYTSNPEARHYFGGVDEERQLLYYSSNARDKACFDIVCQDMNQRMEHIVVENHDNYNIPNSLSLNGEYLLYNKMKGISDNCLWMLNTKDGTTRRVPEDFEISKYGATAWVSTSEGFYFVCDAKSDFSQIYYYDISTKQASLFLESSWDVTKVSISPNQKVFAFVTNEDGYGVLSYVNIETKEVRKETRLPFGVLSPNDGISWKQDSSALLISLSSGTRCQDVWLVSLEDEACAPITNSTDASLQAELVEPRLMHFHSFDGLQAPFWLYEPKGSTGKQLPVLIDIHGGPEGQRRPIYDPVTQYLVSQGIAVVSPNIRGSVGYGKVYTHLDDTYKRLDSVRDIEWLVQHLKQEEISDPNKVAVMGGSYGGFMTLSCAARIPKAFCCAVDVVGMFNLVTFLENTSTYRRSHRESEYGTLQHDRDMLFEVSPVAKVDDIVCPLMVIHGKNDPRVPVSEAIDVVEYLRKKDQEVAFLCYEDEGHGIAKLKNKLDCYPQVVSFLKKHMDL